MTLAEYNLCVELYADGIYRFLLKNLRNAVLAEDMVQDSFEKLWKHYTEVNYQKAKSYLFTTAYHTMIDSIRKSHRNEELEEAAYVCDKRTDSYSDLGEVIQKAVDLLPSIQRSVVLLRDYEGYNYQEIETITGLNESQVKVYIYRARQFLKNYIGSLENVI
ncbi:MAG: RNA polymerase sigma factor [Bacteroidota bacterium]|nr:MAG: RNA polymerase sigma factor [Bacteroidota bacterium]